MKFNLIPFIALMAPMLLASDGSAQCRKFSKKRVVTSLQGGQTIDQITAGHLGRGESAAALIEVKTTGVVDLIISTHPDLGEVAFHVVDTKGAKLASGFLEGSVENLPLDVEADVDLIVHISSEMPSSPYVPIGCVSLATTKVIPNEMDILSGQ